MMLDMIVMLGDSDVGHDSNVGQVTNVTKTSLNCSFVYDTSLLFTQGFFLTSKGAQWIIFRREHITTKSWQNLKNLLMFLCQN